jgi:hypothetical protein
VFVLQEVADVRWVAEEAEPNSSITAITSRVTIRVTSIGQPQRAKNAW